MFEFVLLLMRLLLLFIPEIEKLCLIELVAAKKEIEILKRNLQDGKKKLRLKKSDKFFFALFAGLSDKFKSLFTLVKPETVLKWYQNFVKHRWNYPHKKRAGRLETPKNIKELILKMKNENISWGNKKIQGELLKLGIELDKNTIAKIIAKFRKLGKVKKGLTWKNFILSHLKSLYAMDYFTVDTLFGKRLYVFFIIYLGTREIVQMRITDMPSHRFVRQQLLGWREGQEDKKVYLIHDNDPTFKYIDYEALGIKNVPTSIQAPNMNAFAERFVKSVRKEALDWFVIFNYKQLEKILKEYIRYYNKQRPHQGIAQQVPAGYKAQPEGQVVSVPVLSGLHHHYQRKAS